MKKKLFIILSIILSLFVVFGIYTYLTVTSNMEDIRNQEIQDIIFTEYQDDIYQGEFYYEGVGITVYIEIQSGSIISINYEDHLNGRGDDAENIKKDILEEQSITVDDVAGATISSRCIKLAIMDAFKEANNEQ